MTSTKQKETQHKTTRKNIFQRISACRSAQFSGNPHLCARRKNAGFTLMELLVYLAIFALVILGLFQFLTSILSNQQRGSAREAVIENANIAMHAINFEIRHGIDVYDPVTTSTTTSIEQLSLITDRKNLLGSEETETYVDFFVNSEGQLCRKTEPKGVECLTTEDVVIKKLKFNHIGSGVRTELTVENDASGAENKLPIDLRSYTRFRDYE